MSTMSGETPSAPGSSGSDRNMVQIKKEKEDDQVKVEGPDESSHESSKEIPDESSVTKDRKAEGGAAGGSGVDDVTQGMSQLEMPQDKSTQTMPTCTDEKMACLFRIKDETEDFVYYTYRSSVRFSRDPDLEKMKLFQKERLLDIRSDFPKARIIAFMYNGNWDKRVRTLLGNNAIKKRGTNDTRHVYPVVNSTTTTDLLRNIRKWMMDGDKNGWMADYSDWKVYDCSQQLNGDASSVGENRVFIKLIMACIFRIPDDPTDLIHITHRRFGHEKSYQKKKLDSVRCQRVFPNAKLIAFVYRSYWEKTDANEAMKPFCEPGEPFLHTEKDRMVYRLKPGTSNYDILRGIRSKMTYGRMADYTKRVYDCSDRDANANGEAVIVSDDDVFIDTTIPAHDPDSDESD